jgi:uncharacterized protein (TIGR00255 family)
MTRTIVEVKGLLEGWRVKEGESLAADLTSRLAEIEAHIKGIEDIVPRVLKDYREGLEREMTRLLEGRVDESRLLQEAAIFAQKADIRGVIFSARRSSARPTP